MEEIKNETKKLNLRARDGFYIAIIGVICSLLAEISPALSLIGGVAVLTGFFFGVTGIIQIRRRNERGLGFAITAVVLGSFGVLGVLAVLFLSIF